MNTQLLVFLYDHLAGVLRDVGNAQIEFSYDQSYLTEVAVPISNSLPLQDDAFSDVQCRAFFSGLLPDDTKLDSLARYLKVSRNNVFKLLSEVGEECAGAVSIKSAEQHSSSLNRTNINDEIDGIDLEHILLSADHKPMVGGDEKVRLSLAGAQSKIAIIIQGSDKGQFYLSSPDNPSTDILKPPSKVIEGLVQNEHFCMQLAQSIGIEVPQSNVLKIGNTSVYQVERYDRTMGHQGSRIRIHQEDFCQALGVSPENKYESEGGPNIQDCIQLIYSQSSTPARDYQRLLERIIFNYLIGNNDAHAKNFSLLYEGKTTHLAPAYDLVCTAIYSDLNPKMAMKIGGRYKSDELQRRHWERLVPDTNSAKNSLNRQVLKMCTKLKPSAHKLINDLGGSDSDHRVIQDIGQLIETRINRLITLFN